MEEEANRLNISSNPDKEETHSPVDMDAKREADARSVYVGNVDYGASADEVKALFSPCGAVKRVTILCNKFSGHPKGFAYVEFEERSAAEAALDMDNKEFRERILKVLLANNCDFKSNI